ncbi:MAG: hypothetical protein WA825_04365, partial [Steroidobacteraceae bacterium]
MPLAKLLRARATIAFLVVAACIGPRWVLAADPGYEIQLGVIESDNIQRLPSGGTDETIATQELDLDWHEKRPRFDADVVADISHLDFLQGTYAPEFIGNFIGISKVSLVENLLSWNFADNFGQTPLNPLAPINPGNIQNINYFNTGPLLTLPLGRELQLVVSGQYGLVDYQQTPDNSHRLTGTVGLAPELSPET